MPVSQSRLLICLLASTLLSTTVLADSVVINTTVDENNTDNQSCSLREAVNYLNAKNAKKVINTQEVAIISGTSAQLSTDLNLAQQALELEQKKASPDAALIAQLNSTINELTLKIDAGLAGLNRKLNQTQDELEKENSKATPDTALIADYNATITQLNSDIVTKQAEKTAKETELKDFRATGLWGCFSNDDSSSDFITLPTLASAYTLDAPLTINLSITINGTALIENADGTIQPLEDNSLALPLRPIIKANAAHNLLIIDDGEDNNATALSQPITVSFNNIDFVGCNQLCAPKGGIFLNKESLTLSRTVLSNGQATSGGAIYNDANAGLVIKQSVFKNNHAIDGAAIFSVFNNISIEGSLVTQNKTTDTNKGIVSIDSDTASFSSSFIIPHIDNSTFSGNEGVAILAHGDILFNNNTIVNNTIGISLNNKLPLIYNSIIAGNSQKDCDLFAVIPNDGNTYFANNLSVQGKGCPSAVAENHNIFISNTGDETLLAALDSNNRCAASPAVGLLCPLDEFGGLTKTHKPRLLASYNTLADSPIVNKGFFSITGHLGFSCKNTDQRNLARENNENRCDIGAVELQAGLQSATQGDDIVFGQIKRFSPLDNLGDAELLPASSCAAILGAGEYLNGCIQVINQPKHGIVSFDTQTADILYSTSNPKFHGFDTFSYGVITTLSRFSDAPNDRILSTNVRVVSEPAGSVASKTLDNGSLNIFSLLILSSLLAVWRRRR